MVNSVTIKSNCFDGLREKVVYRFEEVTLEIDPKEARTIEKVIGHLRRNRRAYSMACFMLASMLGPISAIYAATSAGVATTAFTTAAGAKAAMAPAVMAAKMSGGKNLILLLQKASFWVGMGITVWGIVEAQLDFPGWKGRILKGVLGYIGILLVPLVFLELQNSMQVDVWDQIDAGLRERAARP